MLAVRGTLRPMSTPRKAPRRRKRISLFLRVTREEKERYKEVLVKEDMRSMSDWARRVLNREAERKLRGAAA